MISNDLPASLIQSGIHVSSEDEAEKSILGQTDQILDGGWVNDINAMLSFNKAFVTKGMMKHVDD